MLLGKEAKGPLTTCILPLTLPSALQLCAGLQSLVASLIMRIMHESGVLNFNCLNNKLGRQAAAAAVAAATSSVFDVTYQYT